MYDQFIQMVMEKDSDLYGTRTKHFKSFVWGRKTDRNDLRRRKFKTRCCLLRKRRIYMIFPRKLSRPFPDNDFPKLPEDLQIRPL